jgi:hypothetical protein
MRFGKFVEALLFVVNTVANPEAMRTPQMADAKVVVR